MKHIAYVSFDKVPAPKGASTHIEAFVRGLAAEFEAVDLVTVSPSANAVAPIERWPGVMHWELPALGSSLIDRVICFGGFLARWLEARQFDVIHFRSIFEGLPILRSGNGAALIFEVNGLPSIELKYRYPGSEDDRELMRKIESQERACILAADRIITPSGVTRDFLVKSLGAHREKIAVIPNGVDTRLFHPRECETGTHYRLLYFGTLSPWQGVHLAIRAVARVVGTSLAVIGTGSRTRIQELTHLAKKLNVADRVTIHPPVSQQELPEELAKCDAVVSPLLWNDRNALQGCCPLKILEGMAAGRPVITSDLAVVRELGRHEEHLVMCKAGSTDALVDAIEKLRGDPELASRLGTNGRRLVEERFTWSHALVSLFWVYPDVLTCRAPTEGVEAVSVPDRS